MTPLTPHTILHASRDCVPRDLAGEIVLLNLRDGTHCGLDPTGAHVWGLIAEGLAFDAVVATLHGRRGAPADQIEGDLRLFFSDLIDPDLLDLEEAAG